MSPSSASPALRGALATLVALVVATGCSAGSDTSATGPGASSSAPSASVPSAPAASPSVPSSGEPSPAGLPRTPTPTGPASASSDAQRLSITVAGDEVSGDTGTVAVPLGRPVELTVTSDVADEVHVHGADVSADVPAGGTVVLEFTQDSPGRFEVELEQRKRVLARLQVS